MALFFGIKHDVITSNLKACFSCLFKWTPPTLPFMRLENRDSLSLTYAHNPTHARASGKVKAARRADEIKKTMSPSFFFKRECKKPLNIEKMREFYAKVYT